MTTPARRRTLPAATLLSAAVAVVCLGLAGCGLFDDDRTSEAPTVVDENGDNETAAGGVDCVDLDVVCVGIVVSPGGIEGRYLQDLVDDSEGLVDSVDFRLADDTSQLGLQLGGFVDAGVDLIVVGGAGTGDHVLEAAERNAELTFISLGTVERSDGEDVPLNLTTIEVATKDAAFLAGAVAGLISTSDKVGAVLGSDIDQEMIDIRTGWEAGARFVNPEIELFTAFHPGGSALGFTDPAWGAETARSQIDSGVDVVFGAGGMTGNAALAEAARSADDADGGVRCVGAFADSWVSVPESQPCLFTSVVVDVEKPLAELIARFVDGDDLTGSVEAPVFLGRFRGVSDDIAEQADQISMLIAQGGIDTDG